MPHMAKTCPHCGYGLVTCVGADDATELIGACGACLHMMFIPYVPEPHVVARLQREAAVAQASIPIQVPEAPSLVADPKTGELVYDPTPEPVGPLATFYPGGEKNG